MSESSEVKAMLERWYSLGKKERREYGYSFRRFISLDSGGLLEYEVTDYRSKTIKPVCTEVEVDVDSSHIDETTLILVPLPEAMLDASLNYIQRHNEPEQKRLVEVPYVAEQTAPNHAMEWNPVQKKAIERRERLERMRLEAIAKRGKTTYKYVKTTEQYLQALRSRAEKKGMDFDLTPEWIEAKMAYEFCEATGVRFRGKGNDPFGRTIDRKDSSKGYTKANCWVTCWIYNRCKMDDNHEDVLEMVASMARMHRIAA